MKKLISLLLAALTVLAPLGSLAEANSDYVSLAVLSQQALSGWHAIYTVHGREVVAKADILWMPETDACPIVEIEQMEMNIDEQVLEKYRGKGNRVDVSAENHYVTIRVDVGKKNYFLKGYSGATGGI